MSADGNSWLQHPSVQGRTHEVLRAIRGSAEENRGRTFGSPSPRQVFEHRPQAARDLEIRRAIESDLAAGQLHEVVPYGRAIDHPQVAVRVTDAIVVQAPPADGAQQAVELIDRQDGGRRIVDGTRQCLDRDIDNDAEGKGGVLLDGALAAHGDGRPQLRVVRRGGAAV